MVGTARQSQQLIDAKKDIMILHRLSGDTAAVLDDLLAKYATLESRTFSLSMLKELIPTSCIPGTDVYQVFQKLNPDNPQSRVKPTNIELKLLFCNLTDVNNVIDLITDEGQKKKRDLGRGMSPKILEYLERCLKKSHQYSSTGVRFQVTRLFESGVPMVITHGERQAAVQKQMDMKSLSDEIRDQIETCVHDFTLFDNENADDAFDYCHSQAQNLLPSYYLDAEKKVDFLCAQDYKSHRHVVKAACQTHVLLKFCAKNEHKEHLLLLNGADFLSFRITKKQFVDSESWNR